MNDESTYDAIVCDLSAIPADQRQSHIELGKSLLASHVVAESDDEVRFELPPDRLADVARFIENERRCCRHLAFALDVAARGERLTLCVTGRGAREELRAVTR